MTDDEGTQSAPAIRPIMVKAPSVISVEFVAKDSPLDDNPNIGGGKRISFRPLYYSLSLLSILSHSALNLALHKASWGSRNVIYHLLRRLETDLIRRAEIIRTI